MRIDITGLVLVLEGMLLFAIASCGDKIVAPPAPLPVTAPIEEPQSIGTALEARAKLPKDAEKWRRELTRSARLEWGLDAPVATFGAQVHAESAWREDATSPVGAQGLSQFMPATATWLSGVDATVGPADPTNPVWALRALAAYDKNLWDSIRLTVDGCNRMAFTLSAYNGGMKWVERDRLKALTQSLRDDVYWANVERVNAGRSEAAWNENRGYSKKILRQLEPLYRAADWGTGMCEVI